jgi:hypothetical protein
MKYSNVPPLSVPSQPSAATGTIILKSAIDGVVMIDGESTGIRIKRGGTVTVPNVSTGLTEVGVKLDGYSMIIKAKNKVMVYGGQTVSVAMGGAFWIAQRGMATQEMQTDGLSAAHPAVKIGEKVHVRNLANGKEVEVTITGRITPSATRIIDLSPSTARALDIGSGGPVEFYFLGYDDYDE